MLLETGLPRCWTGKLMDRESGLSWARSPTDHRRPTYSLTRVWWVARRASRGLQGELGSKWTWNYFLYLFSWVGWQGSEVQFGAYF